MQVDTKELCALRVSKIDGIIWAHLDAMNAISHYFRLLCTKFSK